MTSDSESKRKIVIVNFLWRFAERSGAQVVSLVVSIILARLLNPEVFGTIALITVFIAILNVFVDSGFGNALIQKKDADDIDFSTVFFFNITACVFLYVLMFVSAPWIALFYGDPTLTPLIRVLVLTIIVSGVRNIQQAYVSRTFQFRKFFFATLGALLASAVVGIFMAYNGFGAWALVAQQLTNNIVGTVILWFTVKWRPKAVFSLSRLKVLFDYGWKLLASSLIETVYRQLRQLIIGKMYTPADLGVYNRGEQIPNIIATNTGTSIDSVIFPAMSQVQDDKKRLKGMMREAMMVSTYIMAPMMMGLAGVSTPLVRLLLTEKWLPCVPFLIIFCIAYMFYPIHTANLNAIKAIGRSDLFLKLEIIKKIVGFAALFATMWISVMAMAYSMLFISVASQIINSWPNKRLLNYSYLEQLKDIGPSLLLAATMGGCVYCIGLLNLSDAITLFIQIPCGVLIYWGLSKLLHLEAYEDALKTIKSFRKK